MWRSTDSVLRNYFWGKDLPKLLADLFFEFGCRKWKRKIRYEEKSSISVDGFVFQHHPDNIDHLSSETNKRLALGFAFTDLSLEVCMSFVITHA